MQFDNIDCPNSSMMTSMTTVKDKMSMKYGPHLYLCTRSYDNDVKVIEDITPVPAPEKEVALVHAPEKAKEKVVTPNRRQRISRLGHSMFAQDRPVVDPRTWAHRNPHLYLCIRSYDNDVKVIEDITPVPAPEKEVALVHAPEKAKEKVVTPNRRQRISRLGHSMFAQDRPVVAPRTWAHRNSTTKRPRSLCK